MFNETDIRKAHRHLREADPVMRNIIGAVGPFTLGLERNRLRMLVSSIISQQISGNAAASIFARLRKLIGPGGLNTAFFVYPVPVGGIAFILGWLMLAIGALGLWGKN